MDDVNLYMKFFLQSRLFTEFHFLPLVSALFNSEAESMAASLLIEASRNSHL